MVRRVLSGGVLLALAASTCPALALPAEARAPAEPVLRLTLDAPEACPTEQELASAVLGLVGHAERSIEASIVIREQGGRFFAELRMLGGERRVDATSCRALSEALAVILALTIDPRASTNVAAFEPAVPEASAGDAAEGARPPRASTPAPLARVERESPRVAVASSARDTRLALGASALLLVETGMLPEFAFGVAGLFRIRHDPWAAELGASASLPRSDTLPSAPNTGGELAWASGQANACFVASPALSACLGVEVGRVFGKGFGVDEEVPAGATWVAGIGALVGRVELGGELSFEGRIALAAPTSRPTFGVGGEALYQVSAISGRLLAGIAFR